MKMKRLAMALLLGLVMVSGVQAERGYTVFGNYVCADVENKAYRIATQAWTLGYWTGLNAGMAAGGDSGHVGESTTSDGIYAEVLIICRAEPSLRLSDAVARVWVRLRDAGR
jgi:hypothetical protein